MPPLVNPDRTGAPGLDDWRNAAVVERKGRSPEELTWRNESGFELHPLQTGRELAALPHLGSLPGTAPFTRGADPLPRPWAIPTEVGVDDLARGLPNVDLATYLQLGRRFASLSRIRELADAARARGIAPVTLRGGITFDPFAEALASGAGVADEPFEPIEQTLAESRDWLVELATTMPDVRGLCVQGLPYRELGATPAEELGFCLAAGIELMRAFAHHGLAVDAVAAHLAFRFAVGTELLTEVARIRAARTTWAQVVRAFGAIHKRSLAMHVEAVTSPFESTLRDPHDNLVRATLQAFAAAAAGVEVLSITPFDARLAADHAGSRLALQQHRLLLHEAQLARVVDPLGGSAVVETLTHELGRAAWSTMQRIEAEGGLTKVVAAGGAHAMLAPSKARRDADVATRRRPIVGTSTYVGTDPAPEAAPGLHGRHRSDPFDALQTGPTTTVAALAFDASPLARARVDFVRDLFRAGGHRVVEAAPDAVPADARIVVACGGEASAATIAAWRTDSGSDPRRLRFVAGEDFRRGDDVIAWLHDVGTRLSNGGAR